MVANLSKYFQVAELDLSKYAGSIPEEVASQNRFPTIRESPYVLTLGPHNTLMLSLKGAEDKISMGSEKVILELRVTTNWERVFEGRPLERLENEVMPAYLPGCRWFGGKARVIQEIHILERLPIVHNSNVSYLLFLDVRYTEGTQDLYLLPVSFMLIKKGPESSDTPPGVIARLNIDNDEGVLYDGAYDGNFREALLAGIARRKRIKGSRGELVFHQGRMFRKLLGGKEVPLNSQALKAEQSNTSIFYEDRFYCKLFRNLREGINPDQEVVQFLTERAAFPNTPPFAGSIEYQRTASEPITLGVLQGFVTSQGDAWTYSQDAVGRYFERVLSRAHEIQESSKIPPPLFGIESGQVPPQVLELIEGHYLEMAGLLGKRTGEMHLALSSRPDVQDFAPEPFSMLYQRSVFQSMGGLLRRVLGTLRSNIRNLPKPSQEEASLMLRSEQKMLSHLQRFVGKKFSAMRIRIHGDYHLGQVLYTGKDFVIIDFEGEPVRELTERRLKQSPLKDVAGMVRSFHYAISSARLKETTVRPEDAALLEPWTVIWYRYVSGTFLRSYLDTVKGAAFIPSDEEDLNVMLNAYLLEKAVYELGYELNNRPDWVMTPLKGIRELIESDTFAP